MALTFGLLLIFIRFIRFKSVLFLYIISNNSWFIFSPLTSPRHLRRGARTSRCSTGWGTSPSWSPDSARTWSPAFWRPFQITWTFSRSSTGCDSLYRTSCRNALKNVKIFFCNYLYFFFLHRQRCLDWIALSWRVPRIAIGLVYYLVYD